MSQAATVFDQEIEEKLGYPEDSDFEGWYCVRTNPFPCPAPGCTFVARYMTAAHRIVVWPSSDDRMLLSFANDAGKFGRNPRVVRYESALGPCIAYDRWRQLGTPVHGQQDRPADQPWVKL